MKKHIKKTLLFCCIFCCYTSTIYTQYYCGIIHPDNQALIMGQVLDCFDRAIDISEEELATFLMAGNNEWYDEEVPVPNLSFTPYHQEEVRVDWNDVPGATMYQVRILNLVSQKDHNYWPTNSNIGFLVEREQLYLSLFSTIIWDGISFRKSADFIIIDELPVIRDPLEYDCACSSGLNSSNTRATEINPPRVAVPTGLSLYPNPSNGVIQLSYHLDRAQEVSIWLTDALGKTREMIQTSTLIDKGAHQLTVPLEQFSPGWYHCIVKTEKGIQQQAFLISR